MKLTANERFKAKYVVAESGCWIWRGANTGRRNKLFYGRFHDSDKQRVVQAHTWSFERAGGVVPPGMELDHLCRTPLCVNPRHLEPVTRRENVIRGTSPNALNAAKTYCRRGHELSQENCYALRWPKTRQCKLCARISEQDKRDNARALRAAIAVSS